MSHFIANNQKADVVKLQSVLYMYVEFTMREKTTIITTTGKGKTCFLIKEEKREKTQEEKPKGCKQICGEKTQKW